MFGRMPYILLGIIALCVLCDPWITPEIKSFIYALSLTIKSGIFIVLPVLIFGLLFKTAISLANQATKTILFILLCVCCSNFLSTMLSHFVGSGVYECTLSLLLPKTTAPLAPLWTISFKPWISNDMALWAGLIGGVGLAYLKPAFAQQLSGHLEKAVNSLLKLITYVIPLFVMGFVVKLQHDGSIFHIIEDYAFIFGIIFVAQFTYIGVLYFIASQGNLRDCCKSIRHMLPAAITGFSTMSSAAAMPITLVGTEKNAKTSLARSIIPMTVNIHLIGDCFAIPILAYAILKNYGLAEPLWWDYCIFAGYFVFAKFSVAGIPGGGVLVMLPILGKYLGFNDEMMSLITALYILFDPVITSANVLGNGAFAMLIDKAHARRFGFSSVPKDATWNPIANIAKK